MDIYSILLIKIIIYFFLFFALAFFAGSETAITSLDKRTMEKYGIEKFRYWLEYPEGILSTILVGTNLAMVGVGVSAVSIATDLHSMDSSIAELSWLLPALTPFFVLVVGEILPKIYCRYYAPFVGNASIGLLTSLAETLTFLNVRLIKISELIIGRKYDNNLFAKNNTASQLFLEPSFKSRKEIKRFLDAIELPVMRDTRTFLKNVVDFRQKRIKDVMIPRRKITAVDISRPREEIFEKIIKSGYSRIPAYRDGNLDNIAGIIYAKDIAYSYRNKDLIVIDDLLRPAYFFPENLPVDKLLPKFREGRFHMAIIVDEHGLVTGLVTIEDIVEEIVGEVWDEHDLVETSVSEHLPDGSIVYKGDVSLNTVMNDFKGLNIPLDEADYSTVGGWAAVLFGEIPATGARLKIDGNFEIEIVDSEPKRIKKVRISKAVN